jgi:hypothetical protein
MCVTNNVTACDHPSLTISGDLKDGMPDASQKDSADVSVAGDNDMDDLATLMQDMAVKNVCVTCQRPYVFFCLATHHLLTCFPASNLKKKRIAVHVAKRLFQLSRRPCPKTARFIAQQRFAKYLNYYSISKSMKAAYRRRLYFLSS